MIKLELEKSEVVLLTMFGVIALLLAFMLGALCVPRRVVPAGSCAAQIAKCQAKEGRPDIEWDKPGIGLGTGRHFVTEDISRK